MQINITEDGAAANFTRSFGMKSGYYLCYSKVIHTGQPRETLKIFNTGLTVILPQNTCMFLYSYLPYMNSLFLQDLTGGMVVVDIQVITDKDSIPHGYCYIAEHLELSEYRCTCMNLLYILGVCMLFCCVMAS